MTEIMDSWDFKTYPKDPLNVMKKRWRYSQIIKNDFRDKVDEKLEQKYSSFMNIDSKEFSDILMLKL
jgi:hypothetical protein